MEYYNRRTIYLLLCEIFGERPSFQDARGKRRPSGNHPRILHRTGIKYKWCSVTADIYAMVSQFCQQYGLEVKSLTRQQALNIPDRPESPWNPRYWYITVFVPNRVYIEV